MADNVEANAGSGGSTFATDDIAGVHYPRTKMVWGADGAVNDTSAAAPLPVVQTGTPALPTDAATETTLASALTALQVIDNIVSGSEAQVDVVTVPAPLSTTGGGTEATALRVTIASDSTGVVSIDDNGAAITVDGTVTANLAAGTNNIGDVDVLSIAAGDNNIGNVDVVTLPALAAGTNLVGIVSAGLNTNTVYAGTTATTPKFAVIDAASSGDNTLVAAVASNKIRVLSLFLVSAGTVTARFESGAGGTALTGQMNLVANSGFVLPFNPTGWFETAVNTLLNLELSGAISVDGSLVYVEVA